MIKTELEPKLIISSVEEAVNIFLDSEQENRMQELVDYLKNNPDDLYEFCLQLPEAFIKTDEQKKIFKNMDKTGIVELARILKFLLKEKE